MQIPFPAPNKQQRNPSGFLFLLPRLTQSVIEISTAMPVVAIHYAGTPLRRNHEHSIYVILHRPLLHDAS